MINHLCFNTATSQTGVEILKGKKPCKFKNVPTKRTEKPKQESRWKVGSHSKNSVKEVFTERKLYKFNTIQHAGWMGRKQVQYVLPLSVARVSASLPYASATGCGEGNGNWKPSCDPAIVTGNPVVILLWRGQTVTPTAEVNSTN